MQERARRLGPWPERERGHIGRKVRANLLFPLMQELTRHDDERRMAKARPAGPYACLGGPQRVQQRAQRLATARAQTYEHAACPMPRMRLAFEELGYLRLYKLEHDAAP